MRICVSGWRQKSARRWGEASRSAPGARMRAGVFAGFNLISTQDASE
jgi:hypothetical protein